MENSQPGLEDDLILGLLVVVFITYLTTL